MVTRRESALVVLTATACSLGFALAAPQPAVLGPVVFEWNAMQVSDTDVGQYRQVIRQPTATLDELELHVTTLAPGLSSHPPHQHPNEELVIIREGTVEVLSGGEWKRVGPGSVVFNAANSPHALRNVGEIPAVYHVINWQTPATRAIELATASEDAGEG